MDDLGGKRHASSTALNKANQKSEYSIDNNDQTHIVKIAATYELPFGKGRTSLNRSGVANVLLGGWQISPILTYASGLPLQVTVGGDPLGNGANANSSVSNRPDLVAGQLTQFSYSNVYKGLPVLNAAAFKDPGPWAIDIEPRYLVSIRASNQQSIQQSAARSGAFRG